MQINGSTQLFPIFDDPVSYVESPVHLTRTFAERGHDGVCVPMQVGEGNLGVAMAGLAVRTNVDGILVTMRHKRAAFGYRATGSDPARSG